MHNRINNTNALLLMKKNCPTIPSFFRPTHAKAISFNDENDTEFIQPKIHIANSVLPFEVLLINSCVIYDH